MTLPTSCPICSEKRVFSSGNSPRPNESYVKFQCMTTVFDSGRIASEGFNCVGQAMIALKSEVESLTAQVKELEDECRRIDANVDQMSNP